MQDELHHCKLKPIFLKEETNTNKKTWFKMKESKICLRESETGGNFQASPKWYIFVQEISTAAHSRGYTIHRSPTKL
jgi:hypothetical protein